MKLRLWHCPTHAAAFETLDVLRLDLTALEDIVQRVASGEYDVRLAMQAWTRTRAAIRTATAGVEPLARRLTHLQAAVQ